MTATGKLQVDIVTPTGAVFSGQVDEVTAPGSEGEFGVLPGHALFITTLKNGLVTIQNDGKTSYYFVSWGYAEVESERVIILADSAEHVEAIDYERAMEAKKRAEEKLKHAADVDEARAQAALERAITRIHIFENFGGGRR